MAGSLASLARVLRAAQPLLAASALPSPSTWTSVAAPTCVCASHLLQSTRHINASSAASFVQPQPQEASRSRDEQASPSAAAGQPQPDEDGTSRASSSGATGEQASGASSEQASGATSEQSSGATSEESTQEQAGASAGQQAEDMRQRLFTSFKSGFGSFASRFGGAEGAAGGQQASASSRVKQLLEVVQQEVANAVLPREEHHSATRAYEGKVYQPQEYQGPTAVQVVKQPETRWQRTLRQVQERMAKVPAFQSIMKLRVGDTAAGRKAGELAEDLKERWETSDHPIVHKVEDVKARLFDPSEQARTMAEIRHRHPAFDMNEFIRGVRNDAPVVVKAFLTHDLATLKQYCGPELLERFDGIFKHYAAQGLYDDPTILFTSEVELVEVKMLEDDPMAILRFNCHQLKCTRDKFGNVVEGSVDSLQRVFYFWGLQQEKHGVITEGGKLLPPRWVLKDMMWQSMLALV